MNDTKTFCNRQQVCVMVLICYYSPDGFYMLVLLLILPLEPRNPCVVRTYRMRIMCFGFLLCKKQV
jgi:hypothetical protein